MCSYGKEIFEASQKEQAIAHIFSKNRQKLYFFLQNSKFLLLYWWTFAVKKSGCWWEVYLFEGSIFFSKFSFFAGDLEHYLGHCITQEVKCLSDNEGLHFSFMVGTICCHVVRWIHLLYWIKVKSGCPVHGWKNMLQEWSQ